MAVDWDKIFGAPKLGGGELADASPAPAPRYAPAPTTQEGADARLAEVEAADQEIRAWAESKRQKKAGGRQPAAPAAERRTPSVGAEKKPDVNWDEIFGPVKAAPAPEPKKPGLMERAGKFLSEGRSQPDPSLSGITPEQARGITGDAQPPPAATPGLSAAVPLGSAKEAARPPKTKAELAREADDAEWRRAEGPGLTAEQVGKDLLGGVEQVKSLATGAAAFGASASWRFADQALADMDAIDATGAPRKTKPSPMGASQVHPYVEAYQSASPEKRAAIRERVGQVLQRDESFISDAAKAIKAYGEEQRRLSGKLPDFTDIRSVKGFAEWAVRNGVATAPTMAVSMIGAVAGMPGLMATGGAMALGDMTSARVNHANQVLDPKRFTSADRAADAVAAQPGATARHLGDNVGATAALAVPYAALDRLGPAGTLAAQGVKGLASGGVRQVLAKGAKEIGAEAVNEGGQEAINIGSDMAAQERGTTLTGEDAKRVVNAAAVGGLMGGAGHAANVTGDVARGFLTPRTKPGDPALPPTQFRAEVIKRFDELAAHFGVRPKPAAAAKQAASEMPADEVPGFLGRIAGALQKRGLVSKPIDEQGLAGLSEALDGKPPEPSGESGGDSSGVLWRGPNADIPVKLADGPVMDGPDGRKYQPVIGPDGKPSFVPADELVRKTGSKEDAAKDEAVSNIEATLKAAGALPDEAINAPGLVDEQNDTGLDETLPRKIAGEQISRDWTAFAPESGTLGIPRSQMPQIAAEHRGALVNFLNARGVAHEMAEVDPAELKPTQAEFQPKKVAGIAESPSTRSLLVSSDGHILDGHHQFLAALETGRPVRVVRLDAPIQDLLRLAHQFPSSTTAKGPSKTAGAPNEQSVVPDPAPSAPRTGPDGPGAAGVSGGTVRPVADGGGSDAALNAAAPVTTQAPAQAAGVPEAAAPTSEKRPAAPVAESLAPGRSADDDGGAAPTQASGAPKTRVIGKYGRTPNGATEIELRPNADGTLTPHTGKYPMVDFESGNPISLPADVTDAQAAKAIRDAGAVTAKDKFYGVKEDAAPVAAAPAAPAPQATPEELLSAAEKRVDGLKALLACLTS